MTNEVNERYCIHSLSLPPQTRGVAELTNALPEPDLVRPLAFAEAEAAEAEEAQREHRPRRGFGYGRRARRSEYGRAMRYEKVERRGGDDFVQSHAAAGPRILWPRHAGRAVERERVEAARKAAEIEDVEAVAGREREAAGQVDREAAVEGRELTDRQRPV